MEWDFFISHASEDKDSFVRPFAEELQKSGYSVWYDEFALTLGDGLRKSIDHGLSNSRYGIVILSHCFFSKDWPQKELDGLAALEIGNSKKIIPVWHNLNYDEVRKYSPTLADKLAVNSTLGIKFIIQKLQEILKPNSSNDKKSSKKEVKKFEKNTNKTITNNVIYDNVIYNNIIENI